VAFERQSHAAGLRATTRTVSLALEEATLAHIGPRAGEGLQTALGYFQNSPVTGNEDLLRRYRAAYGVWAPAVTALSEIVYESIHQYARVVHLDPDGSAAAHGRALRRARAAGAPDTIGRRDLLRPRLYVAQADGASLRILSEVGRPR
jgi:urea transport system substrate-binding protein